MQTTVEAWLSKLEKNPRRIKARDYSKYRLDPAGYMRDVLGCEPWAKQVEIAESLLHPPWKTLATTGHNVGKSWTAAAVVSWWFDTRRPSWVTTTAPTARDVRDVLWTEIRLQRARLGGFVGSGVSPVLRGDTPDHMAKGFTADSGESFQGRHRPNMLFVFDEAIGIEPIYWETLKTMFRPGGEDACLALFNPTDTTTQAYKEFRSGQWTVIRASSLDHPNIALELAGQLPQYPSAVRLEQVNAWVADWCTPLTAYDTPLATDIEWTPGSGRWYRPGPLFECRALGLWPTAGMYSVWSELLWQAAETTIGDVPRDKLPEVGCDPARHGDDDTSIHQKHGIVSLAHESHNGWMFRETARRLVVVCEELAEYANALNKDFHATADQIPIKIDCDGAWGWGVIEHLPDNFNVIPVLASHAARKDVTYQNRRAELWFNVAELARRAKVSLGRLDRKTLDKLHDQAMAPQWWVNNKGKCQLESKEETKERLKGRSPDDMDAMNLAYLPLEGLEPLRKRPPAHEEPKTQTAFRAEHMAQRLSPGRGHQDRLRPR